MKNHKRKLSMLLILLLIFSATLMTACSSSKDDAKKSKAKSETTTESTSEQGEDSGSTNGGSGGSGSSGTGGGSSSGGGSGGGGAATEYCYVTIEGYCSDMAISLQGGDTVYSVTSRTGASLSGSSSYVTGINGRMEKSEGASSGWIFTVNGAQVWKAANGCSVSAGDSICWSFTK